MGGAQAFAVPTSKRARAGSPDEVSSSRGSLERNSTLSVLGSREQSEEKDEDSEDRRRDDGQLTFGEKLRAGKDDKEETSDEDTKPELIAQAGAYFLFLSQAS